LRQGINMFNLGILSFLFLSTLLIGGVVSPAFFGINSSLHESFEYDFSIRIAYKGQFGVVDYADLPMCIVIEENETTLVYHQCYGGGLVNFIPSFVKNVSLYVNALGWGERTDGESGQLGGTTAIAKYTSRGICSSIVATSTYNKCDYVRILRWFIISNITIVFYDGVEVRLNPTANINITFHSISADSGWIYNVSASSSLPQNYVNLNINAHVITIYVDYPPLSLPLIIIFPLIAFIILGIIGITLFVRQCKPKENKNDT